MLSKQTSETIKHTHTHTQEKKDNGGAVCLLFFFNYREHGKERHEGEQLALS